MSAKLGHLLPIENNPQTELVEKLRVYASVLDCMQQGLWYWRKDENTCSIDERWAALIGYTKDELGPLAVEAWKSLAHPDDAERLVTEMAAFFEGRSASYELEFRFRHKRGYYVWLLSRAVVVERDEAGLPLLVAGAHSDITLRKQVEEIARTENETLRAVFDASVDGLFLANAQGYIVDCNESFLEMSGYPLEQALDLPILDMEETALDKEGETRVDRIKRLGKDRFETKMRRADGLTIQIDVGVSYLDRGAGLFVCSCRDISERVLYEEKLLELSILDALTGIFNRRHIMERLSEALARAFRDAVPLSIALFDIDKFKGINDTYGHQAGDQALRDFATVLRSGVREYDLVGRYGGEEFLVILLGEDIGSASLTVERILVNLRSHSTEYGPLRFSFTASAGIACSRECDATHLNEESLLGLADSRLYVAKESGRDRAVWNTAINESCEPE